jgi:hypothetical protein
MGGDKIKEVQKTNLGINHFTKVFKLLVYTIDMQLILF